MDILPDPPATGDAETEALRARMATWFAGVLATVLAVATIVRPLVADVGFEFTVFGIVHTVFIGALWYAFHTGRLRAHAPVILMTAACVLLVPIMVVSGGPTSQFAVLVPLFPICAVLLGGRRMAVGVMGYWCLVLPVMLATAHLVPDLTGDGLHPQKARAQTLWLLLSSGVGLVFALQFERSTSALQQRLIENAERDPLTGVANRRGLDRALRTLIPAAARREAPIALMLVDVDFFKLYNDGHGHADGDIALQAIAGALSSDLRTGQDLVARFGGEEFVVVLSDTDREAARFVAEKLRNSIRALGLTYEPDGGQVLSATIGWSSVTATRDLDPDDLLRRADAALYAGKHRGRDQAVDADTLRPPANPAIGAAAP